MSSWVYAKLLFSDGVFFLGVCSCTKSTKILSTGNATSCTLVPDDFSNGS